MYRLADPDKTLLICRDVNHKSQWKEVKRRNKIIRDFTGGYKNIKAKFKNGQMIGVDKK